MSRTYVVVGGTSGTGSAVLSRLVSAGERVIQLSRHPERVSTRPEVTGLPWGVREHPFPADRLPEVLDGLAYCPGRINLKPSGRLREEDFGDDLELDLMGAMRALQGCLSRLQRAQTGASLVLVRHRCRPNRYAVPYVRRQRQRGRSRG